MPKWQPRWKHGRGRVHCKSMHRNAFEWCQGFRGGVLSWRSLQLERPMRATAVAGAPEPREDWQGTGIECDSHVINVIGMPKMIQIRNVPDVLHKRLVSRADDAGLTLSDYLHGILEREAQYMTITELRKRLAELEPVGTTESSAET